MILVPLSKSAADWVLRQVPLDDESRKVLESACEGLPGRFQEGGFVVQGAESVAKEATGEVILFNAEKGYGLIRADTVEGDGVEAFFASSGLNMAVKVGDKVRFMEDHTMIEGQICAYNIKKLPRHKWNVSTICCEENKSKKHLETGRFKTNVVRLLTRMDESEELPRAQVYGEVTSFGAAVPLVVSASPRGGRGVFAGAAIAEGQEVEVCPVLALQRDHIAAECAAMRYFFGGEHGDVLLCVLGYGMLYNHAKAPVSAAQGLSKDFANLTYALHASPAQLRDARDGNVCVRFVARRRIQEGEELLIDYSDRWWQTKGEQPL
ncbi:unnamed protein product [Cladocopium goreaui]|uniref:CSD domain-containing protein n=1 Tax=Cladocopium goreaui TaxID=2562237 RepID=A0A9P1BL04_9DINO|nr:unnamed protein product [Cladocopium goreaui]